MQTLQGTGLLGLLEKWAPIVAPLALIQPWLIALAKKLLFKGRIDAYEAAWVEVGFSGFGPTIGMMGTLRAIHRDQFVRQIDLTLIRLKDGATHSFNWIGFRAERLSSSSGPELNFELAAGFLVATTQPHRYNILFVDSGSQSDMRPYLDNLQKAWEPPQLAVALGAGQPNPSPLVERLLQLPEAERLPRLYEEFSQGKAHVDAFSAINRILYWEPGDYTIQMNIRTARPDRTFSKRWTVRLTTDDSERLRLNTLGILRGALGMGVTFNFAYPRYTPK
jgi:hypothetical protein